ncbi:inositol monophosphatase family protein [Paraliomyxa miuraensis]|uniref:inositol monophosphatase family protein n=1 Tax=Paraliomyxa miuraensis TaxID=376150 RepID=UPI0022591397|nr:inositol monophosphatase family protein [Paraliomyxa miuraensis]MCX4247562.1 inositol monophosphatase [Paraliomyxa miuraensis]
MSPASFVGPEGLTAEGLEARLEVALEAAVAAGARLMQRFEGALEIETKSSDADLVTQADREAEAEVLQRLRAAFPHDGLVAEESGEVATTEGPCWYVDPLDGTTNFAHRFPHFSVSIGLYSSVGEPGLGDGLLGVVHDPTRGETFFGCRGQGAWLRSPRHGERRLLVTDTDALSRSLLATGFGYDRARGINIEEFGYLVRRVRGIRRPGSAALDLAYVAAGRLDGYWEYGLQPWDCAAGVVLVREAGGEVTTMRGRPWTLRGPSVCASGPALAPALRAELAVARPDGASA